MRLCSKRRLDDALARAGRPGWALPAKMSCTGSVRRRATRRTSRSRSGEQQRGPLVGGHAPREADGHDVRVEDVVQLGEGPRRLSVPGELAAQPDRARTPHGLLLLHVRLPEARRRDLVEALPEAVAPRGRPRSGRGRRRARVMSSRMGWPDPGRRVDAVRDAEDGAVDERRPGLVGGLGRAAALTPLAAIVLRSAKAVMSNWLCVAVHAHAHARRSARGRARSHPTHGRRERAHEVGREALVAGRHGRVDR